MELRALLEVVSISPSIAQQQEEADTPNFSNRDLLIYAIGRIEKVEERIIQLSATVGREARADRERDEEMSAETQAAIDELKSEVSPLTDAVQAVTAVIDGLVTQLEEAGDDPAEIREVIASMKSNRDALAAAAIKGTPAAPPV